MTDIGAIVGRFQSPDLHKGHKELIDYVQTQHRKVIILLGVSPVKLSRTNPLDYFTRELMIKKAYPRIVVAAIKDMPTDEMWSKELDKAIEPIASDSSVTLYGSRDSFIPHYSGKYKVNKLPASYTISATEARDSASKEVRAERGYRVGIIYASYNKYPISYQCVDAIIYNDEGQILLGRKNHDGGKWRFPGGFVQPEDTSLEQAVMREAREEITGVEIDDPTYLFSINVDDWRYRNEKDKIKTAVFSLKYVFGHPEASDDLDEVCWFDQNKLDLVTEHIPLWKLAKKQLSTYKEKK